MSEVSLPRGVPIDIARQIREQGAVLDVPFTQGLYKPLLDRQPRDNVQVIREQVYGMHQRHRLDVYLPQDGRSDMPVLVFMPGGGFVRGDKSERDNVGLYFARRGMMVIVANYRLAPDDQWPAGAEDVIATYQWARDKAAQFGGNPERIFLAGESAGAAHVAAAALIKRFHPAAGLKIAGLLLVSGVYNVHLERLARQQFNVATPDPRNEAYFGSDFAGYPQKSTVSLIDVPPLPVFMSYAELDLLQMQVQAGELFATLVIRHGFMPDLHMIRDHNHLTQVYAINTGDETLSRPMFDFMQRHV